MKSFRVATTHDVDTITSIMHHYYAEEGYVFNASEAKTALHDLTQNEHLGRLWVIGVDDVVVGYLVVTLGFSLEYRGRDAFIDELFIVEDYRGQGLGRKALDVAERYCCEAEVKALHLEVEEHRVIALELYRQAGFKDHERTLMTKWLGD